MLALTRRSEHMADGVRSAKNPVIDRAHLLAYKTKGSPRWAVQEASRVLKRPDVRAVIREIEDMVPAVIEEAVAVAGITKARTLLELSHIGLANMADYVDLIQQEGKLDLSQLTRAQTAAI